MFVLFSALLPIFFIILCGTLIQRFWIQEAVFWRKCEQLIYYILFPCLLITKLGEADFLFAGIQDTLVALFLASGVIICLLFIYKFFIKTDGATFSSMFQGSIRFNAYVFIAIVTQLFDDKAISLAAIVAACMIVFVNITSVLAISVYGTSGFRVASLLHSFAQNPLLLAVFIGATLSVTSVQLPNIMLLTMEYVGSATLPISLLAVGAGLSFTINKNRWLAVLVATLAKLVLLPLLTIGLLLLFGITGTIQSIAVLYAAGPCASSAYILARQMGGDAQVMASIITFTTLISSVTIPVALFVLDVL